MPFAKSNGRVARGIVSAPGIADMINELSPSYSVAVKYLLR